ncbi:hypothetical protein TSUD_188150 [Trifolium subterraneum]|uniref:Uncharacterized protein n=1 Tax=Trifolium subterraneum TaxID=3900 RepID=A0A2Z6NXW9_TRISU|nr:hypothetical protein TSUD_188150 [Trifolium subterraneum]
MDSDGKAIIISTNNGGMGGSNGRQQSVSSSTIKAFNFEFGTTSNDLEKEQIIDFDGVVLDKAVSR